MTCYLMLWGLLTVTDCFDGVWRTVPERHIQHGKGDQTQQSQLKLNVPYPYTLNDYQITCAKEKDQRSVDVPSIFRCQR